MPRLGLATLNHSPLHGLPTHRSTHLDAAKQAGFDALAPDIFWLRALDKEAAPLESLAEALEERDLTCMEIAGLAIGSEEQTTSELEENLRYARILRAEFVNTRVVAPPDDAVIDRLARSIDALASVGTRIAIEFSNGTALKNLTQAVEFLDRVRARDATDPNGLGLTLDTWHFTQAQGGPDWKALEALPLDSLANVQLSDGVPFDERAYGEETMNHRRMPGAGSFDLSRIALCLRDKGFDGDVIVEVLSSKLRADSIGDFAQQAGRATRQWWDG
jgi:sugar phosphate isomerase/epimerase